MGACIPEEDRAESAQHPDLALSEPMIERALGVVVSKEFTFRVIVNEHPFSRRGVLSTVASVFDPLCFVALFILIGNGYCKRCAVT